MHDFRAFSDDDPEEKSTEVVVDEVTLAEAGDLILVRVTGSHFIWKMVRRMVGVLVEVGKGDLAIDDVDSLLGGTKVPPLRPAPLRPAPLHPAPLHPARVTAPAAGLFLERVFYQGDQRQWPLQPAVPVRPARD
jgi:tRNA pseudouridine38-40 synthase